MLMSCRLVADAAEAGSVIGKGERVVERIKKNTGCKITVLTDDLPLCASSSDEIIEVPRLVRMHSNEMKAEPPTIVVATFGSLCQMLERHTFLLETVRVLIVDEDIQETHVAPIVNVFGVDCASGDKNLHKAATTWT